MVARSSAAHRAHVLDLEPVAYAARSGTYGGLVGQLINEIDTRMASNRAHVDDVQTPEDMFHIVSVCGGYAGLIAGFGAIVAAMWLFL